MSTLASAKTFLLNNGRLLERHLFSYLFEGGERTQVLNALRAYQNEDGGFGNALEPDKRTPTSQPIDQEMSLRILDDIGLNGQLVTDICNYLETITDDSGGVPFILPSAADAPRAWWWNTDETNPPGSINPTASIAGLLHKHKFMHPWLSKATAYCWQELETLEDFSDNNLLCILLFLEHVPDKDRAREAFEKIAPIVLEHTAIEPNAEGYVHYPYHYAPIPTSLAKQLYDPELMTKHLEALIENQQEDGGWNISWPAVSPGCELEYRGVVTLNALKTLKAYDYL